MCDLVLSRCCIYCLLPAASCLVHAACNKRQKRKEQEQPQLVGGTERGTGCGDKALSWLRVEVVLRL